MIDYFFGSYLMKFNNIDINYTPDNKLAVVLVATKTSFWLPLIIKNALDKIKKCTFYFFGTCETIFFVQNNLKLDINYFEINDIKHISNYNKILLNDMFWNKFNEEYILIIQPDCIILRDVIDTDFKFDYIGAVCGNLNETNCTFDSSQFSNYTRNYQLNSKEFLVKDTIRYCVDYKNNTVFSFKKSNDFSNSKRVDGFLNSGEITDSGLGYYFIYQFEIEEDKLVRYSCRTDGPSSNKCIDNKNIGKWIYGIKR